MHQRLHMIFRWVGYALAKPEAPIVQAQLVQLIHTQLQIWPQGSGLENALGLGHFSIVEFWSMQGACKKKKVNTKKNVIFRLCGCCF